ncbi:hypothetical protein [Sulfitobacter sp.]|uniref:hypothetical protein n=1 Tax=Sulfitobacter sp. TaxID=1903071 RepID=UPI0030028287
MNIEKKGLKLKFCALALAALISTPAMGAGVLYECDLNSKRANGWVSQKMAFVFEDSGAVKVIDSVLLNFEIGPMNARARTSGDVSRLTWNIAGATDSVGQRVPTFSYTAKLNLKTLGLSVLAKPVGYPQRFTGKGSCVKRNNAKGFPKSLR